MKIRSNTLSTVCTAGLVAGLAVFQVSAQAPAATTDMTQMQRELSSLREQARVLEQRMQAAAAGHAQPGAGMAAPPPAKPGMGMGMGEKEKMGNKMGKPMAPMAPAATMAPPAAAGGMGMDMMKMMEMMQPMMSGKAMSGTNAMGGVNSATAMATPSALPGFPGQSHLYHIGATGFFLDHPEHITLTTAQQQMLAQHKQQALLKQTAQQGQIDAAEQALWQLTGADQPQLGEIEKKTREIEQLRGDQRATYIRAVGGAAEMLTDEQRKQLVGMAPAQPMATPAPMAMPDDAMPMPDEEPGDM